MHVDEFIDRHGGDRYALWVLALFRFPAVLAIDFREWTSKYKLFCTYEGKRYRVTGCSCMGDLYLHPNFGHDPYGSSPYQEPGFRGVDPAACSEWGDSPAVGIVSCRLGKDGCAHRKADAGCKCPCHQPVSKVS